MKKYEHAYYLEKVIRSGNLRQTIRLLKIALQGHEFDSIAFRGMSGALVAPPLALSLRKELIVVRKPSDLASGSDATHSGYLVEGCKSCKKYVIVDDLIISGRTTCSIYRAIKNFAPNAECIGAILYSNLTKEDIKQELEKRRGLDDPKFQLHKPSDPKAILKGLNCYWTKDRIAPKVITWNSWN